MVLDAIEDLRMVCLRRDENKIRVVDAGILQSIPKFLEHRDRNVRFAALTFLLQLAEDENIKERIAEVLDVSSIVKMLSSGYKSVQHAALNLLLEFSRAESLSKILESVPEGILMLVRLQYNQSGDSFSSKRAEEILGNLEKSLSNVKKMAEIGHFKPLIRHLTQGSEEMQEEMVNCLGDIVQLNVNAITSVANKVCPTLLAMVQNGSKSARRAALRVLERISSYPQVVTMLKDESIIQAIVEELRCESSTNETMSSRVVSAALLASLLETWSELDNAKGNSRDCKLAPDYIIHNSIHMLKKRVSEALDLNLLKVLHCLTKNPSSILKVVSMVKNSQASCTLVALINSRCDELVITTLRLLMALTPYMGHTLVENLCRISGQPENLILREAYEDQITEKQVISAKFLANLPRQSLELNLALAKGDLVPRILDVIDHIHRTEEATSSYTKPYLEALVGILVRLTATLHNSQIAQVAKSYNLTSFFTQQLMRTSIDEVQRLSATALGNLSIESINLSKPIENRTKFQNLFSSPVLSAIGSSSKKKSYRCPVHKGICSSQETFCLVDAKAIGSLLFCLDHENSDVVEAALTAICTLLDERVDVDKSIGLLDEAKIMKHLLNIVKQHNGEGLRQQSFWVIEKFLRSGENKSISDISEDRVLLSNLVTAFHYGDGNTKQMAEKILRHLKKLPQFQNTY